VDPCATQAGITCDSVQTHIALRPAANARGQLALVLNGAGAQPLGYTKLINDLSARGFHVIGLRYASGAGTAVACPESVATSDPDCNRRFRSEMVYGENVASPNGPGYDSATVSIDAKNSIVNRTAQLLEYLRVRFPTEGWDQFQQRNGATCTPNPRYAQCDVDWSKVVSVGHSLGAGNALYLAKANRLAGVSMLSGPIDTFGASPAIVVAPWITEGGFVTPVSVMWGLTHTSETTTLNERAIWDALGLAGPLTSVDNATSPYGGSHQLTTSTPAGCNISGASHNSTAQDICTTGNLGPTWATMAGVTL
jgi:hypothetical protein